MDSIDEAELQITEQRVADVVRSFESNSHEPTELWSRIEYQLDRTRRRRRFRLTLAVATVIAVVAGIVWQVGDRDRDSVSSVPGVQPIRTIDAVCQSLLSMRQDVVPLPDPRLGLRFTIKRMQATYSLATTAVDSVEVLEAAQPIRDALQAWRSMFELDARRRLDQAAINIEGAITKAEADVAGSLAMMVAAVTELHEAGFEACDPQS